MLFRQYRKFGAWRCLRPLPLFAGSLILSATARSSCKNRSFSNNVPERLVPSEIQSAERQLLMDVGQASPSLCTGSALQLGGSVTAPPTRGHVPVLPSAVAEHRRGLICFFGQQESLPDSNRSPTGRKCECLNPS